MQHDFSCRINDVFPVVDISHLDFIRHEHGIFSTNLKVYLAKSCATVQCVELNDGVSESVSMDSTQGKF